MMQHRALKRLPRILNKNYHSQGDGDKGIDSGQTREAFAERKSLDKVNVLRSLGVVNALTKTSLLI